MKLSDCNLALIGVSNHGDTMLKAILTSTGVRLYACYDIDELLSEKIARETGCIRTSTFHEILDDPLIDGLVLSTPNHLHREQATMALDAGKHVLVEKPMTVTVQEARDIVRKQLGSNRIIQVGHNMRKRKLFKRVKELLDEGTIGEIATCHAHISRDLGLKSFVPAWKLNSTFCPIMPMSQLGIHFVDTLQFLLSPITSVSCLHRSTTMEDGGGLSVVDSAVSTLSFKNGVIGTLQTNYVSTDTFLLEFYGTKGKILCYEDLIHLTRTGLKEDYFEAIPIKELSLESYIAELEEFAFCIRAQRQPEVDAVVGLYNVAVIQAMLRSAEEGRVVAIEEMLQG